MSTITSLISSRKLHLAEEIISEHEQMRPSYYEDISAEVRAICVRDVGYHLDYLAEGMDLNDPNIIYDYVAWLRTLFGNLGISDATIIETFQCTGIVLKRYLDKAYWPAIKKYIHLAIIAAERDAEETPEIIPANTELDDLAQQYITSLLATDRRRAMQLIHDAVASGTDVRDLYMKVFQRSQYEIGRLWLTNKVSVAQEHFCSAATQMIMSQLYPHIFNSPRIGKKFLAASIGGELHEIGIRMVADFFEMEGWDTIYLGANTPIQTILTTIAAEKPDIVGLSVTMSFHQTELKELVQRIRKLPAGREIKIIIGGYPFNRNQNLWMRYNVDGYAKDAADAVELANKLTS